MRRMAIRVALMAALLLLAWSPALAAPAQQQVLVQILSPEMNAELRGVVAIRGSASVPGFQFYKVEYGIGPSPAQWAIIGSMHNAPVVNGQLEVWDTTRLPDGVYTLRLQAVKKDGNYDEFYVRQVVIANTRPTATATETGTPEGTPGTPTPVPSTTAQLTPMATATLQIITPTAALVAPTPTATVARPRPVGESFRLDTRGWAEAFCYGAAAMGLVFVLLGIVFGLRKLL